MSAEILIPLAGIALPAVLVPTIMAFRHAARKRELLHLERMKALEAGRPVPGETTWPQAIALASVGAGVPLGSFFITWLAYVTSHRAMPELFVAPMGVSVCALICAWALAGRLFPKPEIRDAGSAAKPVYDPDAYEFAGR